MSLRTELTARALAPATTDYDDHGELETFLAADPEQVELVRQLDDSYRLEIIDKKGNYHTFSFAVDGTVDEIDSEPYDPFGGDHAYELAAGK